MAKIIIGTTDITTEPNPASGEFILAIDSADNKLKKKDSTGTITVIESAGTFSVVNITDADSPYTVLGTEDAILVDTTTGPVQVNLLAATAATKKVDICDAFGQSGVNAITVHPDGSDTINTVAADLLITTPNQSLTFVSNGTTGYNLI